MVGLYDVDWNLIAGPFEDRPAALDYAIRNGIFPFKIEEM